MSVDTIVFFQHGSLRRPAVKVTEADSGDVTINIREGHNEHISLHVNDDPEVPIVFTHHAPELSPSGPNDARVAIATKLGYRNPEKHGHYTIHQYMDLNRLENVHEDGPPRGVFLIGRRLSISRASARTKYDKFPQITVELPADECMVEFRLATEKRPFHDPDFPCVQTGLGAIYVVPKQDHTIPLESAGP